MEGKNVQHLLNGSCSSSTRDNDDAEYDVCDEDLKDEYCDPENPLCLHFYEISTAAYKIRDGIQQTPCTKSQMSQSLGMELYFKKEFLQFTGSFKERGARFTLLQLSPEQQEAGVVAASAGNHALALSYHGHSLGIPVTVVMPIVAPIMKLSACRQFGANVIVKGDDIGESKKYAMCLAKKKGLVYINGYDHPHILAGQGTIGLEILSQVPDIDACIVPVGGGGLIAGIAVAIKTLNPNVKIIGVESERCASFSAALKAGKPVYTKSCSTLADGLAVPTIGVNAFHTSKTLIDKMLIVKEAFIALAILRLIEQEKAVVEGAGAAGLAAIIQGLVPELKGKKVVALLCGGNIDTTALGRVLERGLATEGRLVRFVVTVSDRPGGIAELTKIIADLGVSIKDILHERAWLKSDVFSVQVKCVVETTDIEHSRRLEKRLREIYTHVIWGPEHCGVIDVE
ncbi:uncharacterized protein LOC112574492 [Pomacea canaliculata]|uniref:uncharacterized protein LOC112574492 n=1 Tax=Pomacea canaliculata TaxID=400727 RepID=UPI000D7393BB|nr:uncharacterized protein LOC112574492 [Pomacea canaliculata]